MEEVYGAIAFYLADREAIDAHLRREEGEFDRLLDEARSKDLMFYQKLTDAVRRRSAA